MSTTDVILNSDNKPNMEDITTYVRGEAGKLWIEFNSFVQATYKSKPNITYSSCSAKPGWNVKYKKTGKSLCTLYPEKNSFIVLIVIPLGLIPLIELEIENLQLSIKELIETAKPFNNTKWLMISVNHKAVFDNVKDLLMLKVPGK